LSVFDLKEGHIYKAFDGNRELNKTYMVRNGKLMNSANKQDPEALKSYDNCEWVPLKASIGFEQIETSGPVQRSTTKKASPMSKTSILGLKNGGVYRAPAQFKGLVKRFGSRLLE